jgi:hypothetical protein
MDVLDFAREPVSVRQRAVPGGAGSDWQGAAPGVVG